MKPNMTPPEYPLFQGKPYQPATGGSGGRW